MSSTPDSKLERQAVGEVIFSTVDLTNIQCYKGDRASNKLLSEGILHGDIIKIISSYDNSYSTFGLVCQINNSSLDSIHRPSALGLSTAELEDLQPQIYELLKKEFTSYLFAFSQNKGKIINYIPPRPMMIHDKAFQASEKEILDLTQDLSSIINIIKNNNLDPSLLVNLIQKGYGLRNNDYTFLIKAGQELTLAFSENIDRLMIALKRITPAEVKV